jgi:AcrR family transcriptional regulator
MEARVAEASVVLLRRLPRQDRSAQRIDLILDTAATLIDEVGFGNLTPTLIARRAGMSGPAIYRYFDDVDSIGRSLATRTLGKFLERSEDLLENGALEWKDAIRGAIAVYSELYRHEPGFRWIRFGDPISRNALSDRESNKTTVARRLRDLFILRYDVMPRVDLLKHVETVIEICDSLVARAFETDPDGDEFFIREAERISVDYMTEYLARPVP